VVQIAGLVARRIVCDLAQGEGVRRGEDLALSASAAGLMSILPPAPRFWFSRNHDAGRRNVLARFS
jgi:phosphatidylserine decarboxylase